MGLKVRREMGWAVVAAGVMAAACWAGTRSMVTGDAPARGRADEGTRGHRYAAADYRRASGVDVLREIGDLPQEAAGDLAAVKRLAAATDKGEPPDEVRPARFYHGVSHTMHGLLPQGHNYKEEDPTVRPAGKEWFAEHQLDDRGRLLAMYAHTPEGTAYLTDKLVYQGGELVARLTYSKEGFEFGDYGCYRDGKLRLVARLDGKGNLYSYECFFYAEEREDYTVRFVRADAGTERERMVQESITLSGGVAIRVGGDGRVREVWAPYPREAEKH